MKKLILASGSPRRKELLQQAQLSFSIISNEIDETVDEKLSPSEAVEWLASQKANDVFLQHQDCIVIGADTIVSINGMHLGKPNNRDEAKATLQLLSGRSHEVFTGVTIMDEEQTIVFHEKTMVTFWDLSEEEIDQYIQSGEPFDKAGAYGIQGLGALFVKGIDGDYFNVVGLPLARTVRELKNFQLNRS